MMNKLSRILLGLSVALLSTQGFAAEYLVKYKSSYGVMSFGTSNTVQVLDQNTTAQLVKVNIPERFKTSGLVDLFSDPNVEYVVPNAKVHAFFAPVTTQALKDQWAITKVRANEAWAKAGKGSRKVVVAVIDTGADFNHKNLAPNMVKGFDFINNNENPMDQTSSMNPGHGTHCSGIIGATGLVDGGTVGLSPEVSLMPLRFLDQNGSGDLNNAIKAIDYAIEKKVDVISASWGARIPRAQATPLLEAIQRAEKAGITFVVAAANDSANNDKTDYFPTNANLSNTISVAASTSSDAKAGFSNFGQKMVSLSAPGDGIMSTLPGDKYGNLSGTSMATPLVAGLVALVKSQDPSLTPEQLRSVIQASATKVNIEVACNCRVDALGAVETVMNKKMVASPFAGTFAVGDKVKFTGVYGTAPFTFASSTPATATIDANGELTAVANGETVITVTDSKGQTAQTHRIIVGAASSSNPGNPGQPDPGNPGDMECPLDPQMCQVICQIMPDLPWCAR